jgi:hypothetical protein
MEAGVHRYISALPNLFASHGGLQVLTWAVAAGLALGITWLRVGSVGSRKHVLLGG